MITNLSNIKKVVHVNSYKSILSNLEIIIAKIKLSKSTKLNKHCMTCNFCSING